MNAVYYNNKCVFALIGPQSKLLVNISVETAQKALELELLLFKNVDIIKHLVGYSIHKIGVKNWESLKYKYRSISKINA